jgi:hypothetical protein
MSNVSRRDFLKYAGIGALGLVARPRLLGALDKLPGRTDASDVVQCYDVNSTEGASTINEPVVQVMVDESIKALTGIADVGEAWKSIFPGITETSIIGIKVNCVNSLLPTHSVVTRCVISGLGRMVVGSGTFRLNNVIVWDRTDSELTACGYTLYDGADPTRFRCFGSSHGGVGYDQSLTFNVNGVTSRPSVIMSQYSDYLIDAAVLKTHSQGVVTLNMKNHYGSVNNPSSLQHSGGCSPAIPSLNQQIRDVVTPNNIQKLFLIDGLFGLYSGGPGGAPNFNPKLILMSKDPVACDYQGQAVINAERALHGLGQLNAAQITTAAQPPYSLGTTDVNLIEITNPSVGLTDQSSTVSRQSSIAVSPLPLRGHATVAFALLQPSAVTVELLDPAGRVAAELYRGRLSQGRHQLPLNTSRIAAGRYVLRLLSSAGTSVRKVTVLN